MTIPCRSPDAHPATRFAVVRGDPDPVPLQDKLKDLSELVKIGGGAVLTICAALTIRSFMQSGTGEPEPKR